MASNEFQQLPLSAIVASKTNPRTRFNEKELNELAASIKLYGVMQPILVRPINVAEVNSMQADTYEYEVVAGERRFRASKLAGVDYIPAMIRELDDLETLQLQIIENAQREDLHPMEEARGFKALLDNKDAKSWDADKLAEKIGKSKSHIYSALKLNELSVYAQDMFLDDKFGREVAVMIARIPGEKLQKKAVNEIIDPKGEGYSFRAAKRLLHDRYTLNLSQAKFDTNSKDLLPKAGACFSCPKRSGNYPELFSDIESADVCTDPDCFADKKEAHIQLLMTTHERVIRGEDAKKIIPYGTGYSYVSSGYSKADSNNTGLKDNKSWTEILDGDLPEPIIVVDDSNNYVEVYETTALQQKLEEKITSGELVIQPSKPVEKSEWQINRERLEALNKAEEARRLELYNRIGTFTKIAEPLQTLRMTLEFIAENMTVNIKPVMDLYGYEYDGTSQSEHEFFNQIQRKTSNDKELLNLITLLLLLPMTEVPYGWDEGDNEDDKDYQRFISFLKNTYISDESIERFLNLKTASTPPIAAQAEKLNAETEAQTTALETEEKIEATLSPKLQAIKDQELAKRARKAQRQTQKEPANADTLNVPADKAAGTASEVANV